jgi:hypothetical protein
MLSTGACYEARGIVGLVIAFEADVAFGARLAVMRISFKDCAAVNRHS